MHRSHKWLSFICWPATHHLAKMHLPFYSDSNRLRASLVAQLVKNLPAMQWDLGSIPGLGSPGEGKGYPLQYSSLENSMDYTVHGSQRVGHDWVTFTSLHNRLKFLLPSIKICIPTTSTFGSWLAPRPAQYISGPQTPFSLLRSTYISLGVGPTDQGPCPQHIPPPTHTSNMKAKILRKINSEQMSKLYFKLAGKVPVDSGAWRAIQSMESQRVRNDWSNPAQGILKQLKFESCLSRYSFQFLKQPFPKTVFVDRLFPCAVFSPASLK